MNHRAANPRDQKVPTGTDVDSEHDGFSENLDPLIRSAEHGWTHSGSLGRMTTDVVGLFLQEHFLSFVQRKTQS